MATNKNIKTYDINTVFAEYNSFLNAEKEKAEADINALNDEINALNENLNKLTIKATTRNTRLTSAKRKLTKETNKLANFPVLKDEEIVSINEEIAHIQDLTKSYIALYNLSDEVKATNNFEAIKQELFDIKPNPGEHLKDLKDKLTENDKMLLARKEIEINIANINIEIASIENEETVIENTKKDIETKKEDISKLNNSYADNIDNFKAFLKENKLSTIHAEEIYSNNNHQFTVNEVKFRKMHDFRDAFIKKVLIPAAVTGAGIGMGVSALATSGLIGGSSFLEIIPVMSNMAITNTITIAAGTAAGAAAAVIVIGAKNWLTRKHYDFWYKSGYKNYEYYTADKNALSLESLPISKLIEKIKNTNQTVLKSKGLKKHFLNAINRNRIHHVEKVTKQLASKFNRYYKDASLTDDVKIRELKPIYEIYEKIEDLFLNDIEGSKSHILLTCKETKKHTHKSMFENVDIYRNLNACLNVKNLKPNTKNPIKTKEQKVEFGLELINGKKRLIPHMFDYEKLIDFDPKDIEVVDRKLNDDGTITITLADGTSETFNVKEIGINPIKSIKSTPAQKVVKYVDDTKKIIKTPKATKNFDEIYSMRSDIHKMLQDKETVKGLKLTYTTRTINNLMDTLNTWLTINGTEEISKLALKGNTKKLYEECKLIVKETKAEDYATV